MGAFGPKHCFKSFFNITKRASRRGRGPKSAGGGRIAKAGESDCFWEGFLHSTLYLFVCVLLFVFWLFDGLFVDIFLL